jgi:small conductance mechanosensitive channel
MAAANSATAEAGLQLQKAFEATYSKINGWLESLVVMLPNIAVSVLVMIVFWLLSKLCVKILSKLLSKVSSNRQINGLLCSMCSFAVIVTGVFVALGVLHLDKTVTSLLAGVGILGLALGFAFQDLAANFMSGIIMSIRRPFRLGDIVETNDFMGTVEEIQLRSTTISTFLGQLVLIPNKEVFGNPIINYSQTGKRRVDLSVGVSYADDLEKVKTCAIDSVKSLASDGEAELFYTEFGGSSINFVLRFWIEFSSQKQYLKAMSDAIQNIKSSFDENDITIPFPIRTLDFGISGGKELGEVLDFSKQGDERESRNSSDRAS